uniref:RanBD1 domain-containing protein n=1 Tax=Glossina brevipalpis TaxID=37001 RepID=A0A1A9X3P9_9MUSC
MSSKRPAANELNHDNWDVEEEREERGEFRAAPQDELKNRVIKKAKRHVSTTEQTNATEVRDTTKNIFGSFAGLCKETNTSKSFPFAFISKLPVSASGANTATVNFPSSNSPFSTNISKDAQSAQNPIKCDSKAIMPTFSFTTSAESKKEDVGNLMVSDSISKYHEKLINLNQSVCTWIETHVDTNPLCILSPIFTDYEKLLAEIEKEKEQVSDLKTGSSATKATTAPADTFPLNSTDICTTTKINSINGFKFGVKNRLEEADAARINPTAGFNFNSEKPTSSKANTSANSFSFAIPSVENAISPKTLPFANVKASAAQSACADEDDEDEEDQPPKVEFKAVIEENALYSKKCKVFVKKNGSYVDKGVGTLYLKQVESGGKTQLLVRADNNLGIVLVNLILSVGLPAQRMGKNNVMLFCLPMPDFDKATSLLLRVKTKKEQVSDLKTGSSATKATTAPADTFPLNSTDICTTTKMNSINGFKFGVKNRLEEADAARINPTAGFNFNSEKPTSSKANTSANSFSFAIPSVENAISPKTLPFANVKASAAQSACADEDDEDEEDQPPKVEFKAVIEENALYSKKCKVFVKKNGSYVDKGVGTLYLKQVESGGKTQLLVRADNNLGIVLVNLILSVGLPAQRMGKNNVMLFCLPMPDFDKATSLLLRVKTSQEADELLEQIEKFIK